MSDLFWRSSLRANPSSSIPKHIPKQSRPHVKIRLWTPSVSCSERQTNLTQRTSIAPDVVNPWQNNTPPIQQRTSIAPDVVNPWQNNTPPIQQHIPHLQDKMHLRCCRCTGDIESDEGTIFKARCCAPYYMCQDCLRQNMSFYCISCRVTLYSGSFGLIDTPSTTREIPPICDTCNEEPMPGYMLPCNHKICAECVKRETFLKYVTDGKTETEQLFIGCTKHGATKTLHAVQRVHQISYGKQRQIGLACASCSRGLKGYCHEMECGHYTCLTCCSYCNTCVKPSHRMRKAYIPRIEIQKMFNKEHQCKNENMNVNHVKRPFRCRNHMYNADLQLSCEQRLCVTCMEDMAENTLVSLKIEESGAAENYCICLCSSNRRRKHIVSLCFLKKAALQINYLTSDMYLGVCGQPCCTNKAVVRFCDCNHTFCMECLRARLDMVNNKRTKHREIHGERQFCICNTYECKNAIPTDQLRTFVEAKATFVTSALKRYNDSERQFTTSSVQGTAPQSIAEEGLSTVKSSGQRSYFERHEDDICSCKCCTEKSFIKIFECSHKICRKCAVERLESDESHIIDKEEFLVCGMRRCTQLFPANQLRECLDSVTKETTITQKKNEASMSDKANQTPGTSDRQTQFPTTLGLSMSPNTESIKSENLDMEAIETKPNTTDSETQKRKRTTTAANYSQTKNYIKEKPTSYLCNNKRFCSNKSFVEFRDCSHKMCLTCLNERLEDTIGKTVLVCGTYMWCSKEIPVYQLVEYRLKHAPVCDNPGCKAEKDLKTDIRHTFPECGHKLCIMCTSAQQTEHDTTLYCMAADCRPSNFDHGRMAAGHSSSLRDKREILVSAADPLGLLSHDIFQYGIPNIGLTCYASCILQVLGQTPGFKEDLDKYCQQSKQNHVNKILNDILENVNVGADGQVIINWNLMEKLMQRICLIDRSFRMYEENDCHSFLMTLLNALRKEDAGKETDTDEVMEYMSSDEKTRGGNQCRPKEASDGKDPTAIGQDQCPVVLFESRLISKFTYGTCEHEDTVDDQLFRSILVPVHTDLRTLEDGLDLFFKAEGFPDNVLPCRSCKNSEKNTVTTRALQIAKDPKVLMLQLARFEEVQVTGSFKELRKTNHEVIFPKYLSLPKRYSVDERELEYELYGVVLHSGSMHGGHYTSCVRKQNTDRWFYCSDSSVREVKEEDLFQKSTLRNAYVLFYSRKM